MKAWRESYKDKLILPERIEATVKIIREKDQTIATLNGSFDLLHSGHLHMIYEASQLADILILALNTDKSIQTYKSAHRPVVSLKERLQMVAAIGFVDFITYFEETDPRNLYEKIRPDVHVNGSEYGSDCIESDIIKKYGGRVHIVSLLHGLSTTQLLEKIKAMPCV
tara:strand:+ start:82 stop:582 length:501 start_codon:yes stop_codon:yes gene_type:complete